MAWRQVQTCPPHAEGSPRMGTQVAATASSFPSSGLRTRRLADLNKDSLHLSSVRAAVDRSVALLLSRQAFDGHWIGELQGDTILESEYVLLLAFLDRERDPKVAKIARYLLTQQMPE